MFGGRVFLEAFDRGIGEMVFSGRGV